MSSSYVVTLLNEVCDELGLPRPTGYVGGQDIHVRQLVGLFHNVGDFIQGAHTWQQLIFKHTFYTVASQDHYALGTKYAALIDETVWDETNHVQVFGPRGVKEWAEVEGRGVSVSPYSSYELRGGYMYLQPTPTDIRTMSYYYYIDAWLILNKDSSRARRAEHDYDVAVWNDDRMLIAGIKARWLRSKRLSYDEEQKEFEDRLKAEIAADTSNRTLSLNPAKSRDVGSGYIVPIGSWSP